MLVYIKNAHLCCRKPPSIKSNITHTIRRRKPCFGSRVAAPIVIFSIKFWTALWAISHWLDNNLLTALNPEAWYQVFGLPTLAEMVINFTTATMYIVMPFFWTSTLTWAGYKVGSSITDSMDKSSAPSASAGSSGGNLGVSTVKGLPRKLK